MTDERPPRRLLRRPAATRQLIEIIGWVHDRDPGAARRLADRFTDAASRICAFPTLYRLRPDIGDGARMVTVGRYVMLYRLPDDESVEIVAYAHGVRDLTDLLR